MPDLPVVAPDHVLDLATTLGAREGRSIEVALPSSDRTVVIRSYVRDEVRAEAPIPRCPTCWAPNKPALAFEGATTWAEFIIVRLLERAGWDGRWVRNWTGGRQFCVDVDLQRALPPGPAEVFAAVHRRAPQLRGAGTWDVFAWSGDNFLFVESKQHRTSDRLNANQIAWLEAALDEGFSSDQFAIVEYDAGPPDRSVLTRPLRVSRPRTARPASLPSAEPPAEFVELLRAVRQIDRSERIHSRDAIAGYGAVAVGPMVEWLQDDELRRFAIAVLEVIGRRERKALVALRTYADTGGADAQLAQAAAARVQAVTLRRRATPR